MDRHRTLNATAFKATCLDLLDQLGDRRLDRVEVTKRGRVVAVLTPPEPDVPRLGTLHGALRGSVIVPPDLDLTDPMPDELLDAETGRLHR